MSPLFSSMSAVLLVLSSVIFLSCVQGIPTDGKRKYDQLQATAMTTPSHLNLNSPTSPYDLSPVSFDDIMQGRFKPIPVSQTTLQQILEGQNDPYTLLFSDQPRHDWAPIIELTRPRPFRSLNALMHRYKHLHIYRHSPTTADPHILESMILLMRRPDRPPGILISPGSRIVGLNERIAEIERIRRRYGSEVAWARFHKLFTPSEGTGEVRKGRSMWPEIIKSQFVPVFDGDGRSVRDHLDRHRMGKFLSLDGTHVLGIRIDQHGIADHFEQAVNEGVPHM